MERRQSWDPTSFAPTHRRSRVWMKATAILVILAFSSFPLRAQAPLYEPDPLTEIKQLIAEERWREVGRHVEVEAARSADINYYYGISLARLERWDEARTAFQR